MNKEFSILQQIGDRIISIAEMGGHYIRVGDSYLICVGGEKFKHLHIKKIICINTEWVVYFDTTGYKMYEAFPTKLARTFSFDSRHYRCHNKPFKTSETNYEIF